MGSASGGGEMSYVCRDFAINEMAGIRHVCWCRMRGIGGEAKKYVAVEGRATKDVG